MLTTHRDGSYLGDWLIKVCFISAPSTKSFLCPITDSVTLVRPYVHHTLVKFLVLFGHILQSTHGIVMIVNDTSPVGP